MTDPSNALFVCKFCGQPAPHEWGVDRRCPEHPDRRDRIDVGGPRARPGYMQSCEFEAIPVRLTCGACLFESTNSAIFGHSHAEGCVLGDEQGE